MISTCGLSLKKVSFSSWVQFICPSPPSNTLLPSFPPHSPSAHCRQVRRRVNYRYLTLRPLLLEGLGETNDLLRDEHQFLRAFLQFIEQCHRLFLGKVYAQFLDHLVVVVAYSAVLRVKRRELGVIIEQRLVCFYHTERLREELLFDKNGTRSCTGLIEHCKETDMFLCVKTNGVAVHRRIFLGISPRFLFVFCHFNMDLVMMRLGLPSYVLYRQVFFWASDFGGKARPQPRVRLFRDARIVSSG